MGPEVGLSVWPRLLQCPFHNPGEKPGTEAPHAGQGSENTSIASGKGEAAHGTSLTSSAAKRAVLVSVLGLSPGHVAMLLAFSCLSLSSVTIGNAQPASLNHGQDHKSRPTCSGQGGLPSVPGYHGLPKVPESQDLAAGYRGGCEVRWRVERGSRVPAGLGSCWFLSIFL